ncbi:MAG: dipeptidyl aminopeptidase [Leifsonia xyli]|nr:MAG: dipeptidyl aminopeptidase [Leifsonia xyli]
MNRKDSTIRPFSENPDFDFEIRGALGNCAAGAGDPGEILAAVAGVHKGDHTGWHAAWRGLADRSFASAAASAAGGHAVSAAAAYLRASGYYSVAVNAASGLDDADALTSAFQRQQEAWQGFLDHTVHRVDAVAIPYEDGTLPGWFFRPSEANGSTLVVVNGSDGAPASLWASSAAAALARGYNVLMFDGPGQQSELFEKSTSFRPDWEAVLTPVYEFVSTLDGVHAEKVAVYGISQGGYWVTRAIAFEHRFAAAIVDPGVVDVSTSWTGHLPKSLLAVLDSGDVAKFDKEMAFGMKFSPETVRTWAFRARPYGKSGYGETITAVRQYDATAFAAQITTPLLILSPDDEQFWPGQAEQLARLTPNVSTLMRFTAAEGADQHCQPLARTVTAERMYDWLDDRLAG